MFTRISTQASAASHRHVAYPSPQFMLIQARLNDDSMLVMLEGGYARVFHGARHDFARRRPPLFSPARQAQKRASPAVHDLFAMS